VSFAARSAIKFSKRRQQTDKECAVSNGKWRFIETPYIFLAVSHLHQKRKLAQKITKRQLRTVHHVRHGLKARQALGLE